MNEDPKLNSHDEGVIEKFAGQMFLFTVSHLAMLILVAAYIIIAVFVYKLYGGRSGALNVKGLIFAGSVILLVVLGVLERAARERFLRCPACGELLKEVPAASGGEKGSSGKDCPKCGARLKR